MATTPNKKSSQQLETLLQQQAVKIAQLEKAQVIEWALERVRSASMTMQNSNDLAEVVAIMYRELESLELSALGFELILFKPKNNLLEYWSNPAGLEIVGGTIPPLGISI